MLIFALVYFGFIGLALFFYMLYQLGGRASKAADEHAARMAASHKI